MAIVVMRACRGGNLKGEAECYGNWIEFRFLFLMFNCPF